jgi:hypothetical protein
VGEFQCVDLYSSEALNGPVSSTDQCEGGSSSLYRSCFCYAGLEEKDEPTPAPSSTGHAIPSSTTMRILVGLSASVIVFCFTLL